MANPFTYSELHSKDEKKAMMVGCFKAAKLDEAKALLYAGCIVDKIEELKIAAGPPSSEA